MYTTHFKMITQPFSERAPIDLILKDERIKEGMARLTYFLECATIACVLGPTGVGKSTLIKLFVNSLSQNRYYPVYIHFTKMKNTSFLKHIASVLGELPKIGKDKVLAQILEKTKKSERLVILILDESHLLEFDSLTDLRLLVSSALDDTPPLKILLVGQNNLHDHLKRTNQIDLLQRIHVRYHLGHLTREQTLDYIDFQMNAAGASDKIFEIDVKNAIYDYSHGVPRQINNISSACLLNAAIQKAQKINLAILRQAISEIN